MKNNSKFKRILFGSIGLFIFLGASINFTLPKHKVTEVGKKVPQIHGIDTMKRPVSLYDIKSKWTIIYFYDTKCIYSKKTTPQLQEIYRKYKDKGLDLLAIPLGMSFDNWKEYIAKNNFSWKNAIDLKKKKTISSKYNITSLPIIYLCDANKVLISKNNEPDSIENKLNELIK